MEARVQTTHFKLPTVTVVIPVFNSESTIEQTIDSVLSQTHQADEIIVVDDGSSDRSVDIAKGYGSQIRIIEQKNSGHARARNAGIKEAKGEFIAMLDADDLWKSDKLKRQLEVASDYDLVYTGVQNIGDAGHVDEFTFEDGVGVSGDHLCPLMLTNFIAHSSVLIRRESLLSVGGYDTELQTSPDWDLWLRMAHAKMNFHCIPEPKTLYRWSSHSNSRRYSRAAKDRVRVLENVMEISDRQRVSEDICKEALKNVWQTSAWFASRDQPGSAALWYFRAIMLKPTSASLWVKFFQTSMNAMLLVVRR